MVAKVHDRKGGKISVEPLTQMFVYMVVIPQVALSWAFRLQSTHGAIDFQDSSNCTWSEWSACKLESEYRCAKTRTLGVLPFEDQLSELPKKVFCHGQAGQVESETCSEGLCPQWNVGNWTDCSSTCNSTMQPWEGFQNREVECLDSNKVMYKSEVCEKLYGLARRPEVERPCECSHKVKPFDPYVGTYNPVGF